MSENKYSQILIRAFVLGYNPIIFAGVITGIFIGLVIGRPDLSAIGLVTVGIPAIIAIASIKLFKNKKTKSNNILTSDREFPTYMIIKLFIISYCISMVVLALTQSRPWYYLIILGISIILLLIAGLTGLPHKYSLLGLYAIFVNLIYSITLSYNLYYGFGDIFPHLLYSEIIYETGTTLPQDIVHYSTFPLYHVFVAMTGLISGIDVQNALFIMAGLMYACLIWFVFSIFLKLDGNSVIAFLAAVLFLVNPYVIFYGTYMITRSMAFVGLILILFVLFVLEKGNWRRSTILLCAVLFMTLVHQVSVVQLLLLIILFWVCDYIIGSNDFIDRNDIAILSIVPVTHWLFFSLGFVELVVLQRIFGGVSEDIEVTETAGQSLHHITYYINTYLITIFVLVGIYVIFTTADQRKLRAVAIFGLLTSPIYLPSPLTSISQADIFRFDRFILMLSPFISYLMAQGLVAITDAISPQNRTIEFKQSVIILFVILFFFSSVLMPVNTPNGADIEEASWTGPTVHFNEPEQKGLDALDQNLVSDRKMYSDHYTIRYLNRNNLVATNQYHTIDTGSDNYREGGVVILRKATLKTEGVMFERSNSRYLQSESDFPNQLQSTNVIYTNDYINAYDTDSREL